MVLLFVSANLWATLSDSDSVREIRKMYQSLEQSRTDQVKLTEFKTEIDNLIREAEITDDNYLAGIAYRYYALYNLLVNNSDEFLPNIRKSTELFEKVSANEEIIKNKLNRGNFYIQNREYDKLGNNSFSTLYEALELSYDIKDYALTVSSYFYLGYIYQNRFIEYDEAVKCYEKAIELLLKYKVEFPLWKLYNNICNCYIYTEEYDKAREFLDDLQQILLVSEVTESDWRQYYLNYGILENRLHNYKLAEQYTQKALKTAIQHSDIKIIELCYQNLIELGKHTQKPELEKKYLSLAYNYFQEHNFLNQQLLYGALLGRFYLEQGQLDQSRVQLTEIEPLPSKAHNYPILREYYRTMADFHESAGNYQLSLEFERKFGVCQDSVLDAEHKLDVVRTVSRQSLAEKKLEIRKLHEIISVRRQREHDIIYFSIAFAILLSSIIFLYIRLNIKKKKLIEEQQKHISSITKMLNIRNELINFDESETESIEGLVNWVIDLLRLVFEETKNIEITVKIGDYEKTDNQLSGDAQVIQNVPINNDYLQGFIRIRGKHNIGKNIPQLIPGIQQFGTQIIKNLRFIELKKQLQDNEVRFRSIFSQIREGLVIVDTNYKISDWNAEAEHISLLASEDVIGNDIRQVIERIVSGDGTLIWQKLTEDFGNEIQFEATIQKIMKFKVFPIIIDKVNYFCLSIMDITYQEELKSQLILNEKMASLGIMTAGIAHEINQPLTTITFTMENLIRNLQENKLDQNTLLIKVNHLQESMDRLTDFIQKILSYTSQSTSFSELFELNNRIDEALKWNLTQIHNNNINIIKKYSENKIYLKGSRIRFDEIIINLISNAITSLKEIRSQREVLITTYFDTQYVIIKVKDNGIGIESENLNKIFLPFYSNRTQEDSTGLGLSIIYNVVKEMKGDIQVFSEKGKWCEFVIKLPYISVNGEIDES